MNEFYNKSILMAKKAFIKNELPVGAVIVKNNKIVSKGYNLKEKHNNPIEHAEIIAIQTAAKKNRDWRLEDCTLYTTMEPCLMCMGAIVESRIKNVVCGCENKKYHDINKKICKENHIKMTFIQNEQNSKKLIYDFFKNIRLK